LAALPRRRVLRGRWDFVVRRWQAREAGFRNLPDRKFLR
jgi:hypothetical protein